MTVMELIDLLGEYDPDAEVRIMSQYNWPFEYSVSSELYAPQPPVTERICWDCTATVTLVDDEWHHPDPDADADHEPNVESDEDDEFQPHDAPTAGAVYLVEGTQLGYGTKAAWR